MKILRILFASVLAAAVGVVGLSYWVYSSLSSPREHERSGEYIVIERGSTPAQIVDQLNAEGVLATRMPLLLYLRLSGASARLQAGEYRFPSPISPIQVLKELEKGSIQTTRLTIPEGFTRFDIAKRIAENFPQDPPVTEDEILLLMADTSLVIDFAPEARNLEGFLYPSTYDFPPDAKPADIIKRTVEQFRKTWKPEWTERARAMGKTPLEIITIASLVETESPVENERPIVASVIYNRLDRRMALGIDQTVVYIAKMQKRWDGTIHKSDIDADSPYNTRRYGGIPPGPISSVSATAIEAALNPAQTNYLYYVLNVEKNDGSHHFYASAAEFEKGKAVYQRWLEKERQEKRANEANN